MQRSFSSSSANYQHHDRSTTRCVPIQFVSNTKHDYNSSDSDSHHQTYLQQTSSTSSLCSSSSTSSANYRILPVRYSSVDRIIQKPVTATANEHGINVRIRFQRPHPHHHHHRHEHKEEYEHHRKTHSSKEHQHYNSCPVLHKNLQNSIYLNQHRPSNIKYIETRSIVRGYSSDQLNKNTHSNTLIIRQQSLPPSSPIVHTRIKHLPLDTQSMFKPIMIREDEE